MTREERETVRKDVNAIDRSIHESKVRSKEAADQILAVSSQLHLTLEEFERAIVLVKKHAHIS